MRPIATTGVLTGCALVVVVQLYMTIPLLDVFAADLGVPTSTASWAGSAFAFAFAAGNLLFAAVSDARGRRRVMTGGLCALAVATAVVAVAPNLQVLVIARAVQGLVGAAVPAVAMVYVTETLGPVARARALSAIGAAFLSASVLGQVYAAAAADLANWRWAFAATAPLMLAGAFMIRRLPEEVQRMPQGIASALATLPRVLVRRELRRPFFAAVVLLLTLVAMYSGLADAAAERYALSAHDLQLVRLAGLPGILLSPLAAPLLTRHGAPRTGCAALILSALGLTIQAASSGLPALVLGSAAAVAGLAMAVPCIVSLVASGASDARGAAIALYGFWVFAGASLGPIASAALSPAGYPLLCVTLAALLAIAALALVTAANPRRGDSERCGNKTSIASR